MFKKSVVIVLAIGAMLIGTASAAQAVEEDPYVSEVSVTVLPAVIGQGESSVITFSDGYFEPGERVGISLSGENASMSSVAFLAPLARTVAATSRVADADGGLVATFTAPAKGAGTYNLAFSGSRSYTAVVTVTGAKIEVPSAVVVTSDPSLANTGGAASPIIVWVGVAAIAAGVVSLVIGLMRRRRA